MTDKVEFKIANLFEEDLSKADVMAMYLLTDINLRLRPKILNDMKPGTRIVSHAFDMGDWEARSARHRQRQERVFLGRARQGRRQMADRAASRSSRSTSSQKYQFFTGKADIGGNPPTSRTASSRARISFSVNGQTYQRQGERQHDRGDDWKATQGLTDQAVDYRINRRSKALPARGAPSIIRAQIA